MGKNTETVANELQEIADMATVGKHADALRRLDALVQKNELGEKVWATRAFVNGHQGDREAAIVDWSKAIGFCQEPHYFYVRGINLFQLGRYKEAIFDFTKVIELSDTLKSDYYTGPAYFFRADSYLRLGDFDKAKSDCTHVRDDMQTWTDKIRSKADILAECNKV